MIYTIIIPHKLPGLNDYIGACRAHRMAGANMKKKTEELIAPYLDDLPPLENPVTLHCHWIDGNGRRDIDNVAFAVKFILDALQKSGKLPNDNRAHVKGIEHTFEVDKEKNHTVSS